MLGVLPRLLFQHPLSNDVANFICQTCKQEHTASSVWTSCFCCTHLFILNIHSLNLNDRGSIRIFFQKRSEAANLKRKTSTSFDVKVTNLDVSA